MIWDGIKDLGALNEYLRVDIQDTGERKVAAFRLSDTFVGTVICQSESAAGVLSSETITDEAGTTGSPTTVGNYMALLDADSVAFRITCSAYTSGSIRAQAAQIPLSV